MSIEGEGLESRVESLEPDAGRPLIEDAMPTLGWHAHVCVGM